MRAKLWLAVLSLYIVWGSTYLAIRYVVETIPPFMYATLRFMIAGVILFIWRRAAGDEMPTARNWKAATIVGTLLLLGGNGLVALAEKNVPSGIAALMVGTSPFWLTFFEALRARGTKPTWQTMLGLVIGFVGVFLLIGPAEITGSNQKIDIFHVLLLLFAPLSWSLGSVYARGADMPKSGLMSTGIQMLTSSVPLFIVSVVTGELNGFSFAHVSMRSWGGLIYLIIFGSLVGFVSYGWLLHNAPISLTSTFAYVNPVVAVFLGWLLAGEELNTRIILASVIIIGSVIFIGGTRRTDVKKPDAEESPQAEERLGVGNQ